MSRNYPGMLPLRGIDQPRRTEAEAWQAIVNWRHAHGVPLGPDKAAQAWDAISIDPNAALQLKASVAPRS